MLTDAEFELVTAAVDGDLVTDRQALFRRLVAESAEAFALYQSLCRDKARLRELPPVPAPPQVHARVMARVHEPQRPTVPARPAVPVRQPVWLPAGLAASLLLLIGGGSFLYFQSREQAARQAEQARLLPRFATHTAAITPIDGGHAAHAGPAARERTPLPRPVRDEVVRIGSPIEIAPLPRPVSGGDFLTSPVAPDGSPFTTVQVRVPLLLPLSDLSDEDGRRRLAAELARDVPYRIDLFVNDPNRAAEALAAAAGRKLKLTVSIDATAGERLRKRVPFAWAVLSDSLTPSEVCDWLAAARHETQSGSRPALTGDIHVIPAGVTEQKDWRELTGTEPPRTKPGRDNGAAPKSNAVARHALLVTFLPREARVSSTTSKEVKLFVERPTERKPGAVPVMIVIRPTNP